MLRNYLSGIEGDTINALLACAAFNFKAALRELKDLFWLYFLSALNFKFSKLKVFISY